MPKSVARQQSERFWFIIIFFWTLWVSLEFVPFGKLSLMRISDVLDAYLPVMMAKKLEVLQYGFTYWSNFLLSGTDNWAWCEEPFHLFDFLPFILPTWIWYFLLMFLQRWLAAYFTYKLCRENLNLSNRISFFCGAAYSLTYWPQREFFYFYGFGVPAIPFFIWILGKLKDVIGFKKYWLSLLLGIFFGITTYVPGGSLFLFPIIFLWAWLIDRYLNRVYFLNFVLFSIGSLIVDLPYIIAGVIYLPLSTRATLDLRLPGTVGNLRGNGIWANYFELVIGFLKEYVAFIVLAIAGYLISKKSKIKSQLKITGVLIFLCTVVATLYLPFHHQLSSLLQSFRGFGFYRYYLAAPFLMVMAAGLGLSLLTNSSFARKKNVGKIFIYILAVFSSFMIIKQSIRIKVNAYKTYANYSLVFERDDLKKLKQQTKNDPEFRVVTAFTEDRWLPHYTLSYGFQIADGYLSVYSKRYHEFWGRVIGPLLSKDPKKYDYFHNWRNKAYLFSPASKSPSFDAPSLSIDHNQPENFSDYYDLDLLSLANVRFVVSRRPLKHPSLKLISAEGDRDEWNAQSKFRRFIALMKGEYHGKVLYIYENADYFPRVFIAGSVKLYEREKDLLVDLGKTDAESLREKVLVLSNHTTEPLRNFRGSNDGSVAIQKYTPDSVIFQVNTPKPTILVHVMSYTPYWKASIDDQKVELFPVYHAFQGVLVPEGSHIVTLDYCPPYRSCT